jgi:HlyD family secretion protein
MSDEQRTVRATTLNMADDPDDQEELIHESLPRARGSRRLLAGPRRLARAVGRAPRRRMALTLILLVVVLIAGATVALVRNFTPAPVYARVTQGNLTLSFPTSGTLQSAVYGTNFAGSGRVSEVDVQVGDSVTTGQTLAKLDTTQLKDAVNEAQATLQAAQTKENDANANLNKIEAQTAADLAAAYDQEQVTIKNCHSGDTLCVQHAKDVYTAAQAAADNQNAAAQSAVNAAQSAVAVSQAQLQTAQDNLAGAVLTAPHSGTIAAINGSVGSVAGKSDTPFIQIADLGSLQVVVLVSVVKVGGVTKGEDAQISVPASGKRTYHGSVESLNPIGQLVGGTLMYPVLIDVDMNTASGANLLPGMSAKATVIVTQRFGVTLIPASAVAFAQAAGDPNHGGFLTRKQVTTALGKSRDLVTELQQEGGDGALDTPTPSYVLTFANDKWTAVPVVLGLTDGKVYEVLKGLTVGQRIVSGQTNSPVHIPTPTPAVTQ